MDTLAGASPLRRSGWGPGSRLRSISEPREPPQLEVADDDVCRWSSGLSWRLDLVVYYCGVPPPVALTHYRPALVPMVMGDSAKAKAEIGRAHV